MKPVAHTADVTFSVGRPWEIKRVTLSTGHVVDVYTKEGDLGLYAGILALVPDFDIGFVVNAAGGKSGSDSVLVSSVLSDMIVDAFLPAVEKVAEQQANKAYAGEYTAAAVGSKLNSSMVISTKDSGLTIESWISNGTQILEALPLLLPVKGLQLYPTGLRKRVGKGGMKVGWRAVLEYPLFGSNNGSFVAGPSDTWADNIEVSYGGVTANDFVFELDGKGQVVNVEPRIMRATLGKL